MQFGYIRLKQCLAQTLDAIAKCQGLEVALGRVTPAMLRLQALLGSARYLLTLMEIEICGIFDEPDSD